MDLLNPSHNSWLHAGSVSLSYHHLSALVQQVLLHLPHPRLFHLVLERDIPSVCAYLALLRSSSTFTVSDLSNYRIIHSVAISHRIQYCISSSPLEDPLLSLHSEYSILTGHSIYIYRSSSPPISEEEAQQLSSNPSILLSTSGSTSSPKLVRLSHNNILSNTVAILDSLPISSDDVGFSSLPFSYTYGLSTLNTHLFAGASYVLSSKSLLESDVKVLLSSYNVTNFAGVPFTYDIISRLDPSSFLPPSIRFLTQAGGRLEHDTQKLFLELSISYGWKFFVMYGQTEATARISCFSLTEFPHKLGSVGRILSNLALNLVPTHTPFELVVSGPSISTGYCTSFEDLLHPHETRTLHTGDLATIDRDGFLFLHGRISRFAKIAGVRISLDHIESSLASSLNAEFRVVSDDTKIVVFTIDKNVKPREIKSLIPVHSSLISIRCLEAFPYTSSGKPDYSSLLSAT